MEKTKQAFHLALLGIKDCFCGILSLIKFLFKKDIDWSLQNLRLPGNPEKSVFNILCHCFGFGILYWVSNYIFNGLLINYVFMKFVIFMGEDLSSVTQLKNVLYGVFFCLWILPVLLISKLLNFFWYQDIANLIFKETGQKKDKNPNVSIIFADEFKNFILQTFYCLQAYAVYLLPLPKFIQVLWYLIHLSLLSSLYAFEYKWGHIGWNLQRRLYTIDKKWPYFLGFGLPLAAVSTYVPSFVDSIILFNSLFSVLVLSSAFTKESQISGFIHPLHSFKIVDCLTDTIISFFLNMFYNEKNTRR